MKRPFSGQGHGGAARRHRTLGALAASALALALATLVPVSAATATDAPANDTWPAATTVHVGDHIVEDTTGATTDPFDVEQSVQWCGTPIAATVWFKLEPTESMQTIIDVSQSSYPAVFTLFQGSPDANPTVLDRCVTKTLTAPGPGQTYYLMVGSTDVVDTGQLVLDISQVLTPTIHATVDPFGSFTKTGSVVIRGGYTCTEADSGIITGQLTQQVGRRFTVSGGGIYGDNLICDGQARPFSFTITPQQGEFAGGRATLQLYAYATTYGAYAEDDPLVTVRLRGR